MVRILCNLPLECFDARANLGVELLTFGPPARMVVEGVHYPYDIAFDPARGSWRELAAALPRGSAVWNVAGAGHCHHPDEPAASAKRGYARKWQDFFGTYLPA